MISEKGATMTQKRRIIYLLMGPALFALACLAIPSSIFDTLAARAAIGTVAWLSLIHI